ncbi:hypothetical protein ABTO47_19760, partial [Acinetobacter baumannii]
ASIVGNNIKLQKKLINSYDFINGKVQIIRVPSYSNATIASTLTAKSWNGTIGGVLVFNVTDTLKLNADIDVSGKGFVGGIDP